MTGRSRQRNPRVFYAPPPKPKKIQISARRLPSIILPQSCLNPVKKKNVGTFDVATQCLTENRRGLRRKVCVNLPAPVQHLETRLGETNATGLNAAAQLQKHGFKWGRMCQKSLTVSHAAEQPTILIQEKDKHKTHKSTKLKSLNIVL